MRLYVPCLFKVVERIKDVFLGIVWQSTPKDMAGVTAALLSDNEEGVRITSKKLMGWANIDQLSALIEDFLGWMNNTKASNPN